MKRHKILFVAHQSDLSGGASKSMISLIQVLRECYHYEIMVLVPSTGALSDTLDKLNIPSLRGKYYWWMGVDHNSRLSSVKWMIKKTVNMLSALWLSYKLADEGIDLVYSNTLTVDIGLALSDLLSVPHISHVREFGMDDYGIWFFDPMDRVENKLSSESSHIITISKSLQQKYQQLLPNKKIHLVYNGINDDFETVDFKIKPSREETQFVVVGYLCEGKRQRDIIEAARILMERGCLSFHIVMVGAGDAKYLYELESLILSYGLSTKITLVGEKNREDIIALLSRSDVGLITSRKEAFGRVTVEYMLASLPVIASNSGANPELIEEGVTGLLYAVGDCKALSEKMYLYINEREFAKQHGMHAREEALQRFSIAHCSKEIHKILIDVLS